MPVPQASRAPQERLITIKNDLQPDDISPNTLQAPPHETDSDSQETINALRYDFFWFILGIYTKIKISFYSISFSRKTANTNSYIPTR